MLNYISANGVKLGLILEDIHPLTNKKDILDNKTKLEIVQHNDKYYLHKNILTIAELFQDQIIYFPVFLDTRGRLYCQTDYLSFQGCELAKSLLEFVNGDEIHLDLSKNGFSNDALSYLKIFGANCYGKDKLSFLNRVK
ncbi:hypothetical protein BB560_000020 [Smittium megazygosporum]|uniref:Uncharacterized protein n=1 Tax=Smittium megazygosporum TaxID=133381 RepID=A0A2T9ZLR5_9FUNG|nr:hypothetical protein BB560_000020 [Smittium megazygosporum]